MMDKKTVFITGASRGIGAATAKKFLAEGWQVAGFYVNNRVEDGENIKYYQADVSDERSIKEAFGKAFLDYKRVDCLVNCAGVLEDKYLDEYNKALMQKVMDVNEVGVYLCTKEVIGKMEEGAIVTISSTAGQVGSSDPIYAATKAAVVAFSKSMAVMLAPKVRVNCVAPGLADTDMGRFGWSQGEFQKRAEMIPLRKIASPQDIANGIYFLASDQAAHITGACLDINGGYVLR
ncbi:hypothetical protein A2379_00060 [Candidatus Amesbacteria bacterium RIFOXYB1_FULL_47_13]|nr:MAG: hypothetical protein A2379_00060 [Candidatus Amesbacteria bacterium RIFOXYB1_FULL_47_13]